MAEVPARERDPRLQAGQGQALTGGSSDVGGALPALQPNEALQPLGVLEAELAPGLRQIEIYTFRGLLGLQWHGPAEAERIVLACPGGMGGYLGPGRGLYPALGQALAPEGIATVVVDYRRPSDLELSVLDAMATMDAAAQRGASRAVAVGHSFGGAVAVNVGVAMARSVAGVCTLSTQSAGCEQAGRLAPRPFLLIHGADDEVLPASTSEVVRALAGGHGEVRILPGEGHGLTGRSAGLTADVAQFVLAAFAQQG